VYYSLRFNAGECPGFGVEPAGLNASTDQEALAQACKCLGISDELITPDAFKAAGGKEVVKWQGDKPTVIYSAEK